MLLMGDKITISLKLCIKCSKKFTCVLHHLDEGREHFLKELLTKPPWFCNLLEPPM